MVGRVKYLLALLLLTGCSAAPAYANKDAVHRIETLGGGVCGATAVGKHVLLTAAHCIGPTDRLLIIDGTGVSIHHIEVDGSDHALIVVAQTFPVHVSLGKPPKQGDRVHWWGNPAGWADMYRTGVVAGLFEGGNTAIDANGWLGDSGSGVFNARGELVGVVSAIAGQQIFKFTVMYQIRYTPEQWEVVQ